MTPIVVGTLIIFAIIIFHAAQRTSDRRKDKEQEKAAGEKLKRLARREVTAMSTMTSWEDTLTHNGYIKNSNGDFLSPDGDILSHAKIEEIFNMTNMAAAVTASNASLNSIHQQTIAANQAHWGNLYAQQSVSTTAQYGVLTIAGTGNSGNIWCNTNPSHTHTTTIGQAVPAPSYNLPSPTGTFTNMMYYDPMSHNWISITIDVAYVSVINQMNTIQIGAMPTSAPGYPLNVPMTPSIMNGDEFSLDEIGDAEIMIKELEHHAD